MKTLVIKAKDTIVERIASLLESLPKNQYEIKILSVPPEESSEETTQSISLKRGSAKDIITYIGQKKSKPYRWNNL